MQITKFMGNRLVTMACVAIVMMANRKYAEEALHNSSKHKDLRTYENKVYIKGIHFNSVCV